MHTAKWQTTHPGAAGSVGRALGALILAVVIALAVVTALATGAFVPGTTIPAPDAAGLSEFRAGERSVGSGLAEFRAGERSVGLSPAEVESLRLGALEQYWLSQPRATEPRRFGGQ